MVKCKNCNNEISEDDIFCRYCGHKTNFNENISDNTLDDSTSNPIENVSETYADENEDNILSSYNDDEGTDNEEDDNEYKDSKDNTSRKIDAKNKLLNIKNIICEKLDSFAEKINNKVNDKIRSKYNIEITLNKFHLIIVSCVLALSLVLVIGLFKGSASPVKDSDLKSYLVNHEMNVSDSTVTLNDENIKSFTVLSRNTTKKENDNVQCTIVVNLDNAEITYNTDFNLAYNKETKSWELSSIENSEITNVVPKKDIDSETIKSLLDGATISDNSLSVFSKTVINKDMIKEVSDISITDGSTPSKKSVTATLLITNNIVEAKVCGTFDVGFNVSDGSYVYETEVFRYDTVDKEKLLSSFTDEDKKNALLNVIENSKSISYEYEVKNVKTTKPLKITKDDITIFNIASFDDSGNVIKAEVNGEASKNDMTKISFSGTVTLSKSIITSNQTSAKININAVELQKIDDNYLKDILVGSKIDKIELTKDICDTLKVRKESSTDSMFEKTYVVALKIDNKSRKVQVDISFDDKDSKWKVKSVFFK